MTRLTNDHLEYLKEIGGLQDALGLARFVRHGDLFAYDPEEHHSDIAKIDRISSQLTPDGKPIVDDGGTVIVRAGRLGFIGTTTSCLIDGDPNERRSETYQKARSLFGRESIVKR